MWLRGSERVQYRAPLIGGEQSGFTRFVLALLPGEQLVVVLEDRSLNHALNL
ncbi:hypothetical protein [Pseudomonas sp. Z1-12]|uniref:hypothetical protein n=1 Tax=Pseudomonas sp. Z1-12 TaxID=2817408 RepID=UPI003DA8519E